MLKNALLTCSCFIKQPALKIHATRAEQSRNKQSMLVNNLEKTIKKQRFNEYSIKIFLKLKNAEGTLITRMIETWVTGKFHYGDLLGLMG